MSFDPWGERVSGWNDSSYRFTWCGGHGNRATSATGPLARNRLALLHGFEVREIACNDGRDEYMPLCQITVQDASNRTLAEIAKNLREKFPEDRVSVLRNGSVITVKQFDHDSQLYFIICHGTFVEEDGYPDIRGTQLESDPIVGFLTIRRPRD